MSSMMPGESEANRDQGSLPSMVEDTFAEAFPMTATRVIVTAEYAQMGSDRRTDDDRLCHERDLLRRRGRNRA